MNISNVTLLRIKERILMQLYHYDIMIDDCENELRRYSEGELDLNTIELFDLKQDLQNMLKFKNELLKREKRVNNRLNNR